ALRRVEPEGEIELSFAQQRLWFLHQFSPESDEYNLSTGVRLNGRLDQAALWTALHEVIARHETLRTTFAATGGRPRQVVHPFLEPELEHVDLRAVDGREEAARRRTGEIAARPYDLERGPLLRALLRRLGEAECVLVLGMHHIVFDGWAIGVLAGGLAALYGAVVSGRARDLGRLGVPY